MHIFVTGATGFIGSNFLNAALCTEGIEITALRRSINSKPRVSLIKEPVWVTKQLDEINSDDLKGIDLILHLAAHSMIPPYDSLENCLYWNLMAPLSLFREGIKAGVNKFIIAGSCFEYGRTGEKQDYMTTDSQLNPTNAYAASKAAASIIFNQFGIQSNVKLSYHRLFHVFGDGEDQTRLWPSLRNAALEGVDFKMTKGEQIRDFINVKDVVSYFIDACFDEGLINGRPKFRNVGSGNPQTILEFSQYWWNKWNAKGRLLIGSLPYRADEVMRYVPQIN